MTRRILALAALVTVAGCSLEKQTVPQLAGPSELGLALAIKVTPDIITQDGSSRATIEIRAFDPNGQLRTTPVDVRLETAVGGVIADIGSLSARTVSTVQGLATVTYLSPPPPPPTAGNDTVVDILVTPIGTNYRNSSGPRSASLRLARPGVLPPPNGAPKAAFFFSPTSPKTGEEIVFDGSSSTDDGQIVSYLWNFGDGATGTGQRAFHDYDLPGTFNVTLTVTDNLGQSNTSVPQNLSVAANTGPTGNFTFSPTSPKTHQSISFNAATSTAALGRDIVSWDWDFGDGTPHVGGETPFHTYTLPGNYTVTLVVTDSAGQKNAVTKPITITP